MYFFRTFDPDQGGPNHKIDIFCQVGAILVKLCSPSWIYTLEPTWIHPTRNHALVGSIITLVFCIGVMSECTALLGQKSGVTGVSDSGFSSCAAPTYYCGSEYF